MQRLRNIQICLQKDDIKAIGGDKLTIVDNRTGKGLDISVMESKDCYYVNSKDFGKFVDKADEPLRLYDPGYMETICNTSRISYIDGDKGVLEYRGYPIEQLAEKSTFL
jgi:citrate synthase